MTEEWDLITEDPFFVKQKLTIRHLEDFCITETQNLTQNS